MKAAGLNPFNFSQIEGTHSSIEQTLTQTDGVIDLADILAAGRCPSATHPGGVVPGIGTTLTIRTFASRSLLTPHVYAVSLSSTIFL